MTDHFRALRGGSLVSDDPGDGDFYDYPCRFEAFPYNCGNDIGFRLCARKPVVTKSPRRMLRGGSWLDFDDNCHSSYRNYDNPGLRLNVIGFRLCARRVQP